jgi:hypothetical protein
MLPVFTGVALMASAGAGIWLAALNVKYRDFRYVVPFIVQFGLYISPVGFSSNIVPPMAPALLPQSDSGVIAGFRWAVSGAVKGSARLRVAVSRPVLVFYPKPMLFTVLAVPVLVIASAARPISLATSVGPHKVSLIRSTLEVTPLIPN